MDEKIELQPGVPIEFCRKCCCGHHGNIGGNQDWCGLDFSGKSCPWTEEERVAEWKRLFGKKE